MRVQIVHALGEWAVGECIETTDQHAEKLIRTGYAVKVRE